MNSYDIFRKLTKGMYFNKFKDDLKKTGAYKKQSEPSEEEPKQEEDDQEEDTDEDEEEDNEEADGSSDQGSGSEESGDESGQDNIDLLSGVQVNKTKKKTKKKHDKQKLLQIHKEEVNRLRNQKRISVWGGDIPDPVMTFEELTERQKVNPLLIENLRTQGFAAPTTIQTQVWPLMMAGREILGCAPTGSGKTAAFLVPLLQQLGGPQRKGFRAVVLAPTRELSRQIYRECLRLSEGLGLRCHMITNVNKAMHKFGPNSAQKFDLLVTTPKRLVHMLQEGDGNTPLNLANVEWLVVDESDRLFEGGVQGFRGQFATVYQACTNPGVRRAFFSATYALEVQEWCKVNLNNMAMVSVGVRNTACSDVNQELKFCGNESGKLLALREIIKKGYEPPVLVFVQTKERAKQLFKELIFDNVMVDVIHADRTQLQRDNVVRAFRERKIWFLICTELMARGIDFKGVNLVINYDFPPSSVSYIHRVGRTGRANHQGRAVTFWTMEDKPYLRAIANVIKRSGQEVPEWMTQVKTRLNKINKKKKLQPKRGGINQDTDNTNKGGRKNTGNKKRKRGDDETNGQETEKKTNNNEGKPKKKKKKKNTQAAQS